MNLSGMTGSKETIEEIIKEQCTTLNNSTITLFIISGIMWMMEPAFQKKIQEIEYNNDTLEYFFGPDTLKYIYKALGIGLMVLGIYFTTIM